MVALEVAHPVLSTKTTSSTLVEPGSHLQFLRKSPRSLRRTLLPLLPSEERSWKRTRERESNRPLAMG